MNVTPSVMLHAQVKANKAAEEFLLYPCGYRTQMIIELSMQRTRLRVAGVRQVVLVSGQSGCSDYT